MAGERQGSFWARWPGEVELAVGMSIAWLVVAALTLAVGRTLVPILAATASAGLAWAWALLTVRARQAPDETLQALKSLSPAEFEAWTAARFRDLGYHVKMTAMPGDHGVDLLAVRRSEVAVVQCKHYRRKSVGEPVLRDLYGAMHGYRAQRAYLVTTGRLTEPARIWVRGKPIEVWDGEYLSRMLEPALPAREPAGSTRLPCPHCGAALVHHRDPQTGRHLLRCADYPHCHYTQPLA